MGLFDRFRSKKEPSRPAQTTAELENQVIEIARRVVPPSQQVEHYFVVSGNRSLIEAFHRIFRMGGPMHGGRESFFQADASTLSSRQAEAKAGSLVFGGHMRMGEKVDSAATIAEVLSAMRWESPSGRVFVAYVSVGPEGAAWVKDAYSTLLGEAMKQGILPFRMYWTANKDAADYVIKSFASAVAA